MKSKKILILTWSYWFGTIIFQPRWVHLKKCIAPYGGKDCLLNILVNIHLALKNPKVYLLVLLVGSRKLEDSQS